MTSELPKHDPTLATRDSLAHDAARARALRWAGVTVASTAVVVYAAGAALEFDLLSSTISFVTFAALFAPTAAFLGLEVTRYRRCPRCGWQQSHRAGLCPDCGYDVGERPVWACDAGHRALAAGLCDCGRRLQPVQPVDVAGPVKRSLWIGAAVFVALVITGLLTRR
jgi:hypothetical protein